jgi:hypothetical protein
MRRVFMAGSAFALALGLMGALRAGDDTRANPDLKKGAGCVEGAIVRLFKAEKFIEFKVEKIVSRETEKSPTARADDERKSGEKADEVREGQMIFLHVADARIVDENGKELKRDDTSAWFSRDAGWSALKEGQRLKVDYTGTRMMPAPKDFPADARAGGDILVYHVEQLKIVPK